MVVKYTILLTVIVLILSGCKKFLEEIPTGSMSDQTTFSSAADGAALTIGPYRALSLWPDKRAYFPASLEYSTGKGYTSYTNAQIIKFETNQVTGNTLANNPWPNWYMGVRDCNFSIEQLPKITDMSADEISKSLGEVRTLRAFYYFCLVRYFGDIVMNTATSTNVNDAQKPQTSLKTIYDEVIIPDLEFAVNESKLADIKSPNGRITKYVARAILADVYLTCAGYPYQEVATDPTKDWCVGGLWTASTYPVINASAKEFLTKAKTQLDVLVNSGVYTLGTYDDLHDPAKDNSGEAIFQAQFLAGVKDNLLIQATLPPLVSVLGTEYGTFIPSLAYFDSYNPADKRIQNRQMFYFSDTKSKIYDSQEGPAANFGRPYLFKYYDYTAIKVTAHSGLNWTFYRYADILLLQTEVNWTLNQHTAGTVSDADVLKGINLVRARALLPPLSGGTCDLKAIMSERAYELVFENKMIWDQRRTRMCLVDGNGQFSALEKFIGHHPTSFSFSFDVMNLLSPIHGKEIENNRKILQNFGYVPKQVGQ